MALKLGSSFGRDDWFFTIFIDIVNQILAVITTVRKHTASFYIYMLQYWHGEIDVTSLSFTKHQTDRIAIGIYGCMNFGTGPSPAVPDFVWRTPFLHLHCAGGMDDCSIQWKFIKFGLKGEYPKNIIKDTVILLTPRKKLKGDTWISDNTFSSFVGSIRQPIECFFNYSNRQKKHQQLTEEVKQK